MITADNITDEQLRALRAEAWEAGDDALITECSLALAKPHHGLMATTVETARARCAELLNQRGGDPGAK